MFHCHINNHAANGMSTVLQYDGYEPVSPDAGHSSHGPAAPLPLGGTPAPADHPHSTATPAPAAPSAASTPAAGRSGAAASGGTQVVLLDNHFSPGTLTIPAGTTVVWDNKGLNYHTTTSRDGLWDSGTFGTGQTYSFTFSTPGTYK